MPLFHASIANWSDWGRVFQSIEAFEGLILEILRREKLPMAKISHLTPGSNAVFRVGEWVIKILAPAESGADTAGDFACEAAGLRHAAACGLKIPRLQAAGVLEDRYLFRYLVMAYVPGREAGPALRGMDRSARQDFARQIRRMTEAMEAAPCPGEPLLAARSGMPEGRGWEAFAPRVREQLQGVRAGLPASRTVYVHGDMTGENLLLTPDGGVCLLDFADGRLADPAYELPPIVLDLMDGDRSMADAFREGEEPAAFAKRCFMGVLLHEYGGDYAQRICRRMLGCEPQDLSSLEQLEEALCRHMSR